MDITVYKPDGSTVAVTSAYTLDMSFGNGGNNFELAIDLDGDRQLGVNWIVAIEGTEYGGIVDGRKADVSGDQTTITWSGRTWHGIMNSHIIAPNAGSDHFAVSGDANRCLESALRQMGLGAFFRVRSANAGVYVSYQFKRPAELGYDGVMNMLRKHGLRLMCKRYEDYTELWAEHTTDRGEAADSDIADFTAENVWRPPNHLYCAGEGEQKDRKILHLYADKNGNVSQKQTMFGIDEVTEIYDYTNADDAKLLEDGTKKLKEMQSFGKVDVDVVSGEEMYVGDTVIAHDRRYGQTVTDTIVKKILKVSNGIPTVTYECGENVSSSGGISHGTAEWSGAGATYSAGSGIRIVDHVISADVTNSTISNVNSSISTVSSDVSTLKQQYNTLLNNYNSLKSQVNNAGGIVESGSRVIDTVTWNWVKFSNGTMHLWGIDHMPNCFIGGGPSAGGFYYTNDIYKNFPVTFTGNFPVVTLQFSMTYGIYGTWLKTVSYTSFGYAAWSNSIKQSVDAYVHIQVTGQWK